MTARGAPFGPRVALLLPLLLATAARAEEPPRVTLSRDPAGAVTVGTPIAITATVLVPTFMPEPPVWPDLQIADAVTRLPERATHPVTARVGGASWSGVARTWEIIPQRAADYDLGAARITITYADPDTSQPVEAELDLPDLGFSATLPAGAEGMDPFLAATRLAIKARVDGLPAAPKPGDAFTLTLTTTASGPPAMFLPPLASRLPDLPGLRAYPREPALADGDPATRTEAVAYVVEQPGRYVLPALALDWWNTGTATRETAATGAITVEVPEPAGWGGRSAGLRPWWALAVAVALVAFAGWAIRRARRRAPREPSARALRRALLRHVRSGPPGAIRPALAAWTAALPRPLPARDAAGIDAALMALERTAYGPAPGADDRNLRRRLHAAIAAARPLPAARRGDALPALNADPEPTRSHAPSHGHGPLAR